MTENCSRFEHGTSDKFCIIGAGSSGLAAAKTFAEFGIGFDCLEAAPDIGGLWNIATSSGAVYETTHLVSSAASTGFDDFLLKAPDDICVEYPNHAQVMTYFRSYARHFGILDKISFNTRVTNARPLGDGRWSVLVAGETVPRIYRGLVVANGHHAKPRWPELPGTFAGELIHSHDYKSPRQLRDKRVLVIGGGNSGSDITIDAVHAGSGTSLSIRRGLWFTPKFYLGFPTHDAVAFMEAVPLPRVAKRVISEVSHFILNGPPDRYGLPKPPHHIDEAHPTMNDEVVRLVTHGRLKVRPAIARIDGHDVHFTDGTSGTFDMIVAATGYEAEFPFLEPGVFLDGNGDTLLRMHIFHSEHKNLFAAGFVQANGSIWKLADYQSRLIARYLKAQDTDPARAAAFDQMLADGTVRMPKVRFVASDRHRFEANYFDYRKALLRLERHFASRSERRRTVAELTEKPWQQPADPAALRWLEPSAARRAAE